MAANFSPVCYLAHYIMINLLGEPFYVPAIHLLYPTNSALLME